MTQEAESQERTDRETGAVNSISDRTRKGGAGGPGVVSPPAPAPLPLESRDGAGSPSGPPVEPAKRAYGRPWPWVRRAVLLVAGGTLIGGLLAWRARLPEAVPVVSPQARHITQTVAASGQVAGRRESSVGSPILGTVAALFASEGQVVKRGQPLARVQNDIAVAQVRQAQQALQTAHAQLAEASVGARPTELQAAHAQLAQAVATAQQRQALVVQRRAEVTQAVARRGLAGQTLARSRYLFQQGAIARQSVDQAEADDQVAAAGVTAAQQAVATAEADRAAAQAAVAAARAQLGTLESGPRTQTIQVARQHVRDAQAALQVAEQQAQIAIIRAPYSGTVTQILAQPGTAVGTNGIVRLVEGGRPEIDLDVDESNLADLRAGQRAVITSSTYRTARLSGSLSEIGSQVDPARGTVRLKVVPDRSALWLRPGETVNVNIIVAQDVRRLVIPTSAVRRLGDSQVVLVIRNGRAVARPVALGEVEGDVVPVLAGLTAQDHLARYGDRVQPDARVREVR